MCDTSSRGSFSPASGIMHDCVPHNFIESNTTAKVKTKILPHEVDSSKRIGINNFYSRFMET
jgi:hypothetical protein